MEKLEKFIDNNYVEFSRLEDSEVCEIPIDNEGYIDCDGLGSETMTELFDCDGLDNEVINYLKTNYRFDYKGICVYLPEGKSEIWVENMLA